MIALYQLPLLAPGVEIPCPYLAVFLFRLQNAKGGDGRIHTTVHENCIHSALPMVDMQRRINKLSPH